MRVRPPRLAERLLRLAFRRRDVWLTVLGDLSEEFVSRAKDGVWSARAWYWKEAVSICGTRFLLGVSVRIRGRKGRTRGRWITGGWIRELRWAIRTSRRRGATTALIVGTLGVGLGASSAVFSVLKQTLWPSYPYADAGRLLVIQGLEDGGPTRLTVPDLGRMRTGLQTLSGSGGYRPASLNLTGRALPERIPAAHVTSGFFRLLGVSPVGMPDFGPEDDVAGASHRAVLSHAVAARLFGSAESALGDQVVLDGASYRIDGVLPRDFWFPETVDAWIPAGLDPAFVDPLPTRSIYRGIGRIRPGATLEAVRAELGSLDPRGDRGPSLTATPLRAWLAGDAERVLVGLQAAGGLLLFLGLVNAAGMILARSLERDRERGVRVALGAGSAGLLKGVFAEAVTLAVAGGVLGLVFAWAAARVLASQVSLDFIGPRTPGLDLTTVTLALGASLVTGFLMSLVPGFDAVRGGDVAPTLGARHLDTRDRRRAQHALLSLQVGLGVALGISAVSLARGLLDVLSHDVGFRQDGVVTMRLSLSEDRHPDAESVARFFEEVESRVRALPGVDAAGVTLALPFSGTNIAMPVGVSTAAGETSTVEANFRTVTAGYFEALGVPLVSGAPVDAGTGVRQGVVSESFARRVGASVLGATLQLSPGEQGMFTVTGVVGDVRHFGLDRPPEPEIYLGYRSYPLNWGYLVAATDRDEGQVVAPIRQAIAELDPAQPVYEVNTLAELVARSTARQRLVTWLVAFFAASALLIIGGGVYGIVAGHVATMRRELGIRAALGARRSALLGRAALRPGPSVLAGLALGAIGSWVAADLIGAFVEGEWSVNGGSTIAACAVILVTAAVGALGPARQAARADPIRALSTD